MQEGMIADITIFDPETIADTSTMKAGERGSYTKGIPFVLVSGQVVIDDGVANTKLRAGQPIRYEPITEGRDRPRVRRRQVPVGRRREGPRRRTQPTRLGERRRVMAIDHP